MEHSIPCAHLEMPSEPSHATSTYLFARGLGERIQLAHQHILVLILEVAVVVTQPSHSAVQWDLQLCDLGSSLHGLTYSPHEPRDWVLLASLITLLEIGSQTATYMQLWCSLSQACNATHVWFKSPMLLASTNVQEQHVVNLLLPDTYQP